MCVWMYGYALVLKTVWQCLTLHVLVEFMTASYALKTATFQSWTLLHFCLQIPDRPLLKSSSVMTYWPQFGRNDHPQKWSVKASEGQRWKGERGRGEGVKGTSKMMKTASKMLSLHLPSERCFHPLGDRWFHPFVTCCQEMAKYLHTNKTAHVWSWFIIAAIGLSMSFTLAPSSSLLCGSGSAPAPVFGVAMWHVIHDWALFKASSRFFCSRKFSSRSFWFSSSTFSAFCSALSLSWIRESIEMCMIPNLPRSAASAKGGYRCRIFFGWTIGFLRFVTTM